MKESSYAPYLGQDQPLCFGKRTTHNARATKIGEMTTMGYGTDGLTFRTLRDANLKRLPMFKDALGRTCHAKDDGSDWSPAQWLQAVVGELGEYANLRKKVERGDKTLAEARPMLADELADVVIYLDILASQLGVDLGKAVMAKWNRTSEKVGAPIYIDAEDWHYTKKPA
jgi:NTP pyrophosphatase (non-canonical NTP hydrolase)